MASSILYFGPNECNRIEVLRSAGYTVREFHVFSDLAAALGETSQPAAVVMIGAKKAVLNPVLTLVHAHIEPAPVIVFPGPGETGFEQSVDLVVPPLTSPAEWLKDIAALVEQSRAVQEASKAIFAESLLLREEVAAVRIKSVLELERSKREWEKVRAIERIMGGQENLKSKGKS